MKKNYCLCLPPHMSCTSSLLTLYSSYRCTLNVEDELEDRNQTIKTNNLDEWNATDDSDI